MNAYANHVVGHLLAQSWQIALLAAIVGLISLALRNRSAHLRYLLWLIVLAKCLVPPFLTVPLAVLPERSSSPSAAGVILPEESSASDTRVPIGGDIEPHKSKPAVPSVRELIALVWAAGAFFFLLWVGGRTVRYTAWLRKRRRPLPPALQESIRESSVGFRFRKWPRIWLLEDINQPFVWGLLRGDAYLPADFVGLNGSDQQRSVLAHELSHIARFDAGVNLLQVMAQAVYWFHPFVWWSNRKIRQEREKCCDEMAIVHLNTPPEHYTGAIVDVLAAERRSPHRIPSLAIVGSVKDIEERIKTMLKPGKTFRRRPSLVAATVALLIGLVTIPTALVLTARGQTQPTAQSMDKPAQLLSVAVADGQKPEQPRYAARTFNSKVALDVWVAETPWPMTWSQIGRTPSTTPLEIPACWVWWVQPVAPVEDWGSLAREVSQNNVPGIALRSASDSDLRHLADLDRLQFLVLQGTSITDASLAHLKGLMQLWGLTLASTEITGSGLEHLKGLDGLQFLNFRRTPVTDDALQYLKGLRGLRHVNLLNTQIGDAGLVHLKGLTGLQALNLISNKITGAGIEALKGLSGLQTLGLRVTQVTDADLVHLEGLTELQSLDFIDTKITDAGLEHLKGLTKLRQMNLANLEITGSGFANFAGMTRLTTLWLSGSQMTDVGLAHLKGLTGLRKLEMGGTQITNAGLIHLKDLTGLQTLKLGSTKITGDAGLEYLKNLPRLQVLSLNGDQITNAGVANLKVLTELQTLGLNSTRITDAGLEYLRGLSKLQELDLSKTQITDAGLVYLKGLTGLQRLDLTATQVTDAGVQQLKQSLPKLTVVRGQGQPTTPSADKPAQVPSQPAAKSEAPQRPQFAARTFNSSAAFTVSVRETPGSVWKEVGRTPSRTPLEIPACLCWSVQPSVPVKDWDLLVHEVSENKVPDLVLVSAIDSDLKHLAGLPELQSLRLGTSREITDAGMTHLAGLTRLQRLDLSGTQVTDAGLEHLKALAELQDLRLKDTQVTDAGLAHLKGLTALQGVALEGTRVTDAGLAHLAGLTGLRWLELQGLQITGAGLGYLKECGGLSVLNLNGAQITDAGLEHLKDRSGLSALYVANTQITDAGLEHLAGMTKLQALDLRDTRVTDAGLAHLKGLTGLQLLWLENTQITDTGLDSLKTLTGLRGLFLKGTQITDAGVQQLKQSLPKVTMVR
jgi:beta-lactamase regulating signal transducer with metallopeptidase domain/Leucine-rich repeat (LRR) protein